MEFWAAYWWEWPLQLFTLQFLARRIALSWVQVGAVGSILGILGDLFASAVKRQCGIKDYGTIFPGHGGILDRFDSVLLTVPFVALCAGFLTGV